MRTELNLKDRNLRIALLKAVTEDIADRMDAEKDLHRTELVERYEDEGTKSFDVKLPNGAKVAAISLSVPKPTTTVVDDEALLKWARDNAPELVTEAVIPGVPAHFVEAVPERVEFVLDRKRVTELLGRVKPADAAGGEVVDPDTGSLVEGVVYTPGAAPKSFSVRYEPDGREALALAYRAGELNDLLVGTPLPAIEGSESDEVRAAEADGGFVAFATLWDLIENAAWPEGGATRAQVLDLLAGTPLPAIESTGSGQ